MVMKPRLFNSGGFGRARPATVAGTYQAGRDQRLAARAARAMGEVTPRASVMACSSEPAAPVPKAELLESKPYRRAVATLGCMWCGIEGFSQHAHLNLGKGLSLKTDDRTGFPLCSTRPGVEGCQVFWLVGIQGFWTAMADVTKRAATRTDVTHDHERCCTA